MQRKAQLLHIRRLINMKKQNLHATIQDLNFRDLTEEAERYWIRTKQQDTGQQLLESDPSLRKIVEAELVKWQKVQKMHKKILKAELHQAQSLKDSLGLWLVKEWLKLTICNEIHNANMHIMRLGDLLGFYKNVPRKFNDNLVHKAKSIPIENIINRPLRKSGKTLSCLCPLHNENTPSFYLYPETNSFYCFGCHAGGDIITLVMKLYNYKFKEAVAFLTKTHV